MKNKKPYIIFLCGCLIGIIFIIVGIVLIKNDYNVPGYVSLCWGAFILLLLYSIKSNANERSKRVQVNAHPISADTFSETGYEYSIKGINFRDIDDTMLGDFEGYVRALKSNRYDPYAIGVYVGNRKVGYLPRDNKDLHKAIMLMGGTAAADGYIAKDSAEDGRTFYYGKVRVLGL